MKPKEIEIENETEIGIRIEVALKSKLEDCEKIQFR